MAKQNEKLLAFALGVFSVVLTVVMVAKSHYSWVTNVVLIIGCVIVVLICAKVVSSNN